MLNGIELCVIGLIKEQQQPNKPYLWEHPHMIQCNNLEVALPKTAWKIISQKKNTRMTHFTI